MVHWLALVVVLLSLDVVWTASASEPRWEASADVGGVHTVGSDPVFDWAVCGGGSLLLRLRQRFGVGVFAAYRQILDSAPASSFWYADIGARVRFSFTERLWLRMDTGWSFRHIGMRDGYSNTVSGFMAGTGLGVIVLARPKWNLSLAAAYHVTWRTQSEVFSTQDMGLSMAWTRWW
jgi:hypothetical protein